MELILAAAVGAVLGWLVGRRTGNVDVADPPPRTHRPTKRQRQILASLPPDPQPPSIDELMEEEASALGIDRVPDAGLPLHVRLKVWRRDHRRLGGCPDGALRFAIDDGVAPDEATEDQVRLEC